MSMIRFELDQFFGKGIRGSEQIRKGEKEREGERAGNELNITLLLMQLHNESYVYK